MTIADPTLKSLKTLDDPSEWVIIPRVPVFDEHTEDIWVPVLDEHGNPVKDANGKIKKRKEKWVCDESELAEICEVNNARETKTGDLCVLTDGHTPDDPNAKQPDVVGVARNWQVGTFGPEKKIAAVHDWYLDRNYLCGGKQCSDEEAHR